MYFGGRGVPQDYKQGAKWFTKAAEQGNATAQSIVGNLYAQGQSVLQDYGRAHIWFNLATANGHERGSENRDNVPEKMTSDQIAEAQKMAREMVEANPTLMGE